MSSTWGRTEIFDFEEGKSSSNSFLIFYQVQPLSLALSLGERTSFSIYVQGRSRNKVRDDRCWWHLENMSSRTEDENKSLIVKLKFWVARSEVLYFLYPSLKFLSSHNSLRNFFSPSRGEIKILHLAASLLSCLAASDMDFASLLLCVFASKSALLDSPPLSSSLPWREDIGQ